LAILESEEEALAMAGRIDETKVVAGFLLA
jgi:hypothetical protein